LAVMRINEHLTNNFQNLLKDRQIQEGETEKID